MDVCANSKSECSKRDGEGDVQGGRTRGVLQPKALVRNVSCVANGAHYPRPQAPRLHVNSWYGEHDARAYPIPRKTAVRTHDRRISLHHEPTQRSIVHFASTCLTAAGRIVGDSTVVPKDALEDSSCLVAKGLSTNLRWRPKL